MVERDSDILKRLKSGHVSISDFKSLNTRIDSRICSVSSLNPDTKFLVIAKSNSGLFEVQIPPLQFSNVLDLRSLSLMPRVL